MTFRAWQRSGRRRPRAAAFAAALRRRWRELLLACAVGLSSAPAVLAASIDSLDVTQAHGLFHLVAHTHLDATPAGVYKVLTTYNDDAYGRISSVYKESRYLAPASDGTPLVYTRVQGCLLFFCRSMRRVERLTVVKPNYICTTAVPSRSDFRYARSVFRLKRDGDGTEVTYRLDMEPDFWLPPFVGPWLLKHVLMRGGSHAVQRIEQLAQQVDDRHADDATRAAANVR